MATSVILACGLNEQLSPALTFLSEQSGVDGSFLINCLLGQRLKTQDSGVIFVCLHNTFQHYSNAGMRLGFNLQQAITKGHLRIVDVLSDINENLFDSQYLTTSKDDLLDTLWNNIVEGLQLLRQKAHITVIIDDLSALFNFGAKYNQLCIFCQRLRNLYQTNANTSSVVKINNANIYPLISSYIKDMADTEINIQRLASGNFKEVDGKLVLHKANSKMNKEILYKVAERSIKVYAPGEVGIKV